MAEELDSRLRGNERVKAFQPCGLGSSDILRWPVEGDSFHRESLMSAVAEPIHLMTVDDALARRNAMVLAVAQALAGGNNTVIVSTASIVGAALAPDKGLATLPITARAASWPPGPTMSTVSPTDSPAARPADRKTTSCVR